MNRKYRSIRVRTYIRSEITNDPYLVYVALKKVARFLPVIFSTGCHGSAIIVVTVTAVGRTFGMEPRDSRTIGTPRDGRTIGTPRRGQRHFGRGRTLAHGLWTSGLFDEVCPQGDSRVFSFAGYRSSIKYPSVRLVNNTWNT